MSRVLLASLLTALLAISTSPVAQANDLSADESKSPPNADEKEIVEAIRQLGDPSFQAREEAQRTLLKIGLPAANLLKEAANAADAEVARRANSILEEFGKRQLEAQAGRLTFDQILERIHRLASSGEWQKPGWTDPLLESGLNKLIDQVRQATKNDRVRLPVGFDDVQPGNEREIRGLAEAGLYVLQGGSVAHARRSIFLVDGSLRVGHAHDCVIIARGAVDIGHGRGNVVLAGHYLHTSHDGNSPQPNGSLLMSGSVLDVSHSKQSICFAPRAVRVSFATGTVFLNSPQLELSHEKNCTRVADAKLSLAPAEKENPLSGKVQITQIVEPDDSGEGGMVVLDQDGVEVVVRPGAEITDGQGKAIPELAGWKLSFVADSFALFSKGQEDAGFCQKRQ